MGNGVRVTIDREGCISCGVCWTMCAEFFEENPNDNRCQVVEAYRAGGGVAEGEAPPNLESAVRGRGGGLPRDGDRGGITAEGAGTRATACA